MLILSLVCHCEKVQKRGKFFVITGKNSISKFLRGNKALITQVLSKQKPFIAHKSCLVNGFKVAKIA